MNRKEAQHRVAVQQALAADRFAREIVPVLMRYLSSTDFSIYWGGG